MSLLNKSLDSAGLKRVSIVGKSSNSYKRYNSLEKEDDDEFKQGFSGELPPLGTRLCKYVKISIPLVLNNIMMMLKETIAVLFIGTLDNPIQLGAVGLGNSLMGFFMWPWIYGCCSAMETLIAHAYGRKDLRECGLWLHRTCFFGTILFIPITIVMLFTDPMLVALGMEKDVAHYAFLYVCVWIPGSLFHFYGDAIC